MATDVFTLPDGLFKIVDPVSGKSYSFDLLEANEKLNAIASGANGEGVAENWHLRQLSEWVLAQCGLVLTLGQADALWNQIRMAFLDAKKKQRERLDSMLTSPSSTESTRADAGDGGRSG
ncbi:MAG TPA: hypothetical protein PJ982_13130 [Lacipirellulaceae bacterium]|nr:hypothetical protein [Lacipirellulaceae bacterium]